MRGGSREITMVVSDISEIYIRYPPDSEINQGISDITERHHRLRDF